MGRLKRVDHPGAVHHLMNRGTARTMLFRSDEDYGAFMYRIGCLEARFAVEIHAYVLMGNHYHLIVRSREGLLSEAMHWLGTGYAQRFNWAHERDGAFFKGRFCSEVIDNEEYLHRAGAYVHLNPLRAGLVDQLGSYRWSSLAGFADRRPPMSWLHTELLRGPRSGEQYLAMVAAHAGEVTALPVPEDDPGISWYADPGPGARTSVTQADRLVAELFGVSIDDLYSVARGRSNTPRLVALRFSAVTAGLSTAQVAKRYGLRNAHTVRSAYQRLRALVANDDVLATKLAALGLTFDQD